MKKERQYYVYILSNCRKTVLYVGVTNDLPRRLVQHRSGQGSRFVEKYNVTRLVYFEAADSAITAIEREKQLKGGPRSKKEILINQHNPEWKDLFEAVMVP